MSDDLYTERVRKALGGQLAPPSFDGHGTRILYRCGTCGRRWLRDGPRAELDLSSEQIHHLAAELHADLADLPRATCRICGAVHAGMEVELDGYHDRGGALLGIGISYEAADPPGAHVLATAHNVAWLERERSVPRAGVIVDFARTRRFLRWLARLAYPTAGYAPISPDESARMARDNPPGHGARGTDGWLWRGGSWYTSVPPLGGRCIVTIGQGTPPAEPYSLGATIAIVRLLAELVLQGRIAGEPPPDPTHI